MMINFKKFIRRKKWKWIWRNTNDEDNKVNKFLSFYEEWWNIKYDNRKKILNKYNFLIQLKKIIKILKKEKIDMKRS